MDNLANAAFENQTCEHFKSIDILKGIGIFLMVLGHSGFPFTRFIYQFHMALFFMASGYCWSRRNSEGNENVRKYIIRQIKTLYVPYVAANLIYLAFNNQFLDWGIYTDDINDFGIHYVYLDAYIGIKEFFRQVIRIFLFMESTRLGSATWFFRSLFFVKAGHCVYEFLIMKFVQNLRLVFIGGAGLICCVLYELQKMDLIVIPTAALQSCLLGYIAYVLGIQMRYLNKRNLNPGLKIALGSLLCILIFNQFGRVTIASAHVPNCIYYIIVSLCGWCLTMFTATLIQKTGFANVFIYLGKHTMPIILLHFLCFKLVSYLYILLADMDMFHLAYFPAMETEEWLWIFYTIAGLTLPLILYQWYENAGIKLNHKRHIQSGR